MSSSEYQNFRHINHPRPNVKLTQRTSFRHGALSWMRINLVHPSNELVDVVLTVTSVTTLNIVVPLLLQATEWCLQLEWPEEVVRLLEMWANRQDLVNKILNADDVVLP